MKPPPSHKRCHRFSNRGYRCRRHSLEHNLFCEFHQPDFTRAELQSAICNPPSRLDTAAAIHELLEKVALAVASGRLKPRQATTVAYVAQVMLTSLSRVEAEKKAAATPSANASENPGLELANALEEAMLENIKGRVGSRPTLRDDIRETVGLQQHPNVASPESPNVKK